ncbi:MAG: hypothetical protein JNL90_08745 [Planctomycetes bacterium]|nr:hypothetical protein [Planctomycetota bacterium]
MRPTAWGVDLTGGAVRAVRMERRGAHYRILDVVEQPTSGSGEGAEELSSHLPEAVGRALIDLLQARRATLGDAIFVALPVFGARHGRVEVPVTDAARAPGLLEFELHQAIAADLEPWIVRASKPRRREGHATASDYFAQRRDLVASFVADLRRFGLPLDGLIPGPLALARYADEEWTQKGRRLVIECHRTRTDLLFLDGDGDRRWRSLPFGCGTLADLPVGAAPRDRESTRIAGQIAREQRDARVALYGAHDGTALERVVLLGEAARHEELRRALERELGQPTVTPHAPRNISVTQRAAPHHPLHLGTAIGLAMAALDPEPDPWSLLPASRARGVARTLPAWTVALLLLALGLLTTSTLARRERAELRATLAELRQKTDFGAHADWNSARQSALDATAGSEALLAEAALVKRRLAFPGRLLEALSDPSVFFRLIEYELRPGERSDGARLVFEVDQGLSGATDTIRDFLRSKVKIEVIDVAEQRNADGVLRVTLTTELPAGSSS